MNRHAEIIEMLLIQETDAWYEYLEATRLKFGRRYADAEPWAWSRLQKRLQAISTRRSKIAA